nr:MAG: ORF1 [TTV-like mini virus]
MARFYYRRWWKPTYRKRYRRYWYRRPRAPLRRRRRRRYRVRRKLKYLPLKQWQPSRINRLNIKGLFCLLQAHKVRFNHNFNQYETSIPPEGLPNGGGFTIVRFTLAALYEQHEKARNIWTKSNKNMPLFRYTGCSIKVYRPLDIDLVLKFQTCYPMCCSKLMYTGTQPSIMMMTKGAKIVRCKRNAPNAKPYKKFRLPPPQQMTNKWYFQHTEQNTGLLLIQASSASLDKYYTSTYADSATITLHSLNTRIFQNMQFDTKDTNGYHPKTRYYLYASNGSNQLQDLIYLGQAKLYNKGTPLKSVKYPSDKTTWQQKVSYYMQHPQLWGNPFHEEHLHKQHKIWFSQTPPLQAIAQQTYNAQTTLSKAHITEVTDELLLDIRYNPFKDKGYNNNVYILPNFTENNDNLEPLPDPDLQNPGFPNWLSIFGFEDYLIKLGKKTKIPEHYIMVFKSPYFEGPLTYYIFVDKWFIHGDTDDLIGRTDFDNNNWYPMIKHQEEALNTLALTGPGAPKMGDIKLAEAKIQYNFHFKVGGCASKVEKIANPADQPTYATPSNILDTNSLQSPAEPIETSLYQFDWRRHQITDTAAERISKDYLSKKHLFADAESPGTSVPLQEAYQKELLSSSEEETEKETLFEQLQRQRLKQRDLKHRIRLLLSQIQKLS